MLRGRPAALVVVCVLGMACLLGDEGARARSLDLVHVLEILIADTASQCADSRLYTPTYVDYKMCPKDTLECFSAEVRVLVTECERTEDDGLEKLERGLKYYLENNHHRNQSQSTCGPCELHPEENVGRFLRELQQTVMASNF